MCTNLFSKSLIAGAAFATLAVMGLVIGSPSSAGEKTITMVRKTKNK